MAPKRPSLTAGLGKDTLKGVVNRTKIYPPYFAINKDNDRFLASNSDDFFGAHVLEHGIPGNKDWEMYDSERHGLTVLSLRGSSKLRRAQLSNLTSEESMLNRIRAAVKAAKARLTEWDAGPSDLAVFDEFEAQTSLKGLIGKLAAFFDQEEHPVSSRPPESPPVAAHFLEGASLSRPMHGGSRWHNWIFH
jgi:hypothetical protein